MAVVADQGNCQLVGQQFIISETAADAAAGFQLQTALRRVQCLDGFAPAQPFLLPHKGSVAPFRQVGQAGQGFGHHGPHPLVGQACRERVDRLKPGQAVLLLGRQDIVGIDHLQRIAVALQTAADQPRAVERQGALNIIALHVEQYQLQRAGGINTGNPPWLAGAGRWLVLQDVDQHRSR